MGGLLQDLRYSVRSLRASPGFLAAAVACLGLGIGANATVFSVVNATVLRPLPYSDPDRLVAVHETLPLRGGQRKTLSYPEFSDWQAGTRSFSGLAAYDLRFYNLGAEGRPEHLDGGAVSWNLFEVLGVRPAVGRAFTRAEDRPGAPRVVILGHRFWQTRLASDPAVVGRTVRVDGAEATVVGVMPPGFDFPAFAELWVPLALDPTTASRGEHDLDAVGRLRPGVTIDEARADLDRMARRLAELFPDTNRGVAAGVQPIAERFLPSTIRSGTLLMLAAVALVLLVACANIAGLLLARSARRARELAVRAALGAGRARLVRLLLVESLFVALLGGAAGTLLASWGLDLVRASIPVPIPGWVRFQLDGPVFLYLLAVSCLAALLSGLVPALRAARADVHEQLKEGTIRITDGPAGGRLRGAMVVSEVALSLVLLISAVLLVRSFLRMQAIETGFEPRGLLTLRLVLAGPRYEDPTARADLFRRLTGDLQGLPGVRAAGAVDYLPPIDSWSSSSFEIEGRSFPRGEEPLALTHPVTARYLEALGVPLLAGRGLREDEAADPRAEVAVVSRRLAELAWPGTDPLGRRLRLAPGQPWLTVVGVAGDVWGGLQIYDVRKPELEVYFPYAGLPRRAMSLVVRADGDPAARHRPRPSALRRGSDGAPDRPRAVAAAVPGADVRRLRHVRPGARGGRHLRRRRAGGQSWDARDRRARCARCPACRRDPAPGWTGPAAGRPRDGVRPRRRADPDAWPRAVPLRSRRHGPAHLRRHPARSGRGRARCELAPGAARRAHRSHGRPEGGVTAMGSLWQDARYAIRMLGRSPAFTAVADPPRRAPRATRVDPLVALKAE